MLQPGTKAIVQFKEGGQVYWSLEMDSLNGTIVTLTHLESFPRGSVAWRCVEHHWVFDPLWLTSVQVDDRGLLLANIRLRSGRVAPRWVRQDNPNIVDFVPAEPKPVPVGLDETPTTVHVPLYGCCGGSMQLQVPRWLLDRHEDKAGPIPEALKGFLDIRIKGFQRSIESQEQFLKNNRSMSPSNRTYYENELRNLCGRLKALEGVTTVKASDLRYNWGVQFSKNTGILLGFENLGPGTKEWNGLFVKLEQEAPDDPVEEFPVPKVLNRQKVDLEGSCRVFQQFRFESGRKVHWAYGCTGTGTANIMYTEIAQNADVKPDDLFLFILNRDQMTETKSSRLAQAGFERILVTGNRNHPGTSMLYLYGRKVTEGDKA